MSYYIIQIYILHRYIGQVLVKLFLSWGGGYVIFEFSFFLLLETPNNASRNAYFVGVFFIVDNDVWYAFLWFLFINHFCRRKWNANRDYYIQIKQHCPMKRSFLRFLRKYSDVWMKANNTLILTKCHPSSFHHLSTLLNYYCFQSYKVQKCPLLYN